MAVTINKAVVPEDYTYLVVNSTQSIAIDGSTTTSGSLSSTPVVISPTGFGATMIETKPAYDLVAEYSYAFKTVTKNAIGSVGDASNIILSCTINVGEDVCSYYRYIRFIIKPNITITNTLSSTPRHVYMDFSVQLGSLGSYTFNKKLSTLPISNRMVFTTSTYAFVFDTKTRTIYDYTSKGTNLWSSL